MSTKKLGPQTVTSQIAKQFWVRNYQIRKLPQLRNFCKFKSANLGICELRNLFADRPPLLPSSCIHMEWNYIRVGILPVPPPHLVPPAPNFFPISVLLEVRENGSVEKICWLQGGGKHLLEVRLGVIPGCKTENFFGCKNR